MGEKDKSQDDSTVSDLNNLKNGTTPTQKLGQATGRTGLQRKLRNSALVFKSEVSFTYSSQESTSQHSKAKKKRWDDFPCQILRFINTTDKRYKDKNISEKK